MKTKNKFNTTISLILFVGFLTVAFNSNAQERRAGIKGGLNVTNLYIDDVDDENARYGVHLGIYGQVLSTDAFAIQPELLYSGKGTRAEYTGIIDQDAQFNLHYIDLPVLAVFKLGKAAEIHLGPYVGYLISTDVTYDGDIVNGTDDLDRDNFKSFDYGLSGGIGLNFGALQIGARYNYGLAEIADSNAAKSILGDSKNSNAQLFVAFNFNTM